jgi:hypothetical protein
MSNVPSPPQSRILGGAILAIFLVVAGLLFAGVYLGLPLNGHFYALIAIGILSLVLALGAYLAQAVAPDPMLPRALAWGFAGLGFALLAGTILTNPTGVLTQIWQVVALVLILGFLGLTLVGGYWRYRTTAVDAVRLERREGWRASEPRSALDYAAAQHDRDVSQNPTAPVKGPP